MTQRLDFCDVSHWQGSIDWRRVAAAGILGAIAKCTDGKSYLDDQYQANRAGALDSGLAFASYHFLQHGSGAGQMAWYLSQATPRPGERVVIDYENESVTIDDLKSAVEYLRVTRPDLQLSIYGANKLADDVNAAADVSWLAGTSLWAARYSTSEPKVGKAWSTYTAWQYSQTGSIAGIDGDVDLNSFNGGRENCIKWFGPASDPAPIPPEPAPAPEPAPVSKDVVITAPPGTVFIINGVRVDA